MKRTSAVWLMAPVFVATATICAMLKCRGADPWERFLRAAAESDSRPLESLPADLQYRPLPADKSVPPALRLAASVILEKSVAAEQDASKQHAAGVALLILHQPSTAVVHLERAVQMSTGDASWWNDLAVAKYEAGRPANTPLLMEALAAIDRAIALRLKTPIAHFNRALILEALKLRVSASHAWRVCMSTDPSSGVAAEARRRFESWKDEPRSARWRNELPRLRRAVADGDARTIHEIVQRFPQESRTWGELLFLGGWAGGDRPLNERADHLALARAAGVALRDSTGESLLADAVAVIDAASASKLAALRRAQQTYIEGRALYRDRRVGESLPRFRSAVADFQREGSPMAEVAGYYVANALHDLGRHAESLTIIDALLDRVPKRYIALRSQLLWERGSVLTRTGKLTDALIVQREALRQFEKLGEAANATHMLNMIAISLSLLGRRDEAWALRQDLFDRASQVGDAALLQTILDSTARADALGQHWSEAFSLLTLCLEPAVQTNARVAATSHLWRALASARLGLATGAADVAAARHIAPRVVDPVLRSSVLIEADFAEAILSALVDPSRAKRLLTRYIDAGLMARDAYLLPEACLARARLRRSEGDSAGAIADLQEAWRWLERRRDGTADEYRDAYFATRDHVRRELVDIHCDRAEYWQALAAAEERIEPSGAPLDRITMTSAIPAGTIAVRYVVLPRRLVIFVLSNRAFETVMVPVAPEVLARTSSELAEAIAGDRESAVRDPSARLGQWLLAPVSNSLRNAQRLIVVTDAALDAVPYAMLPFSDEQKPLIYAMELLFSRSIVFTDHTDGAVPLRVGSVLAVGDPRFDPALFPSLDRLRAAEQEARSVAAIYEQSEILTGTAATPAAVIKGLKTAAVADFATHAVVVASAPSRSFLVLAGSAADAGTLRVDDIARLRIGSLRLVVLAGCRTAAPTTGGGTATSIAQAFTRAGAHNAIGSLWDMDDNIALWWSRTLHRRIRAGITPAAALRETQVHMSRSTDPAVRKYRAWGGLRLYGGL